MKIIMTLIAAIVLSSCSSVDARDQSPARLLQWVKVCEYVQIPVYGMIDRPASDSEVFVGLLIGGAIGNQFGGGSGKDVATILGAIIGGSAANNRHNQPKKVVIRLVELMIEVDSGEKFMVIQDVDPQMTFHSSDKVRMIYLENSTVRIDKQR